MSLATLGSEALFDRDQQTIARAILSFQCNSKEISDGEICSGGARKNRTTAGTFYLHPTMTAVRNSAQSDRLPASQFWAWVPAVTVQV